MSHLFVAEIKGSEPQAVRSGVFLAIGRPQHPPEKATRTGTGIGVLVFLPSFLGAVTLALLCRQERLHMGFISAGEALHTGGKLKQLRSTSTRAKSPDLPLASSVSITAVVVST